MLRPTRLVIENMNYIKHAEVPMYRMITQVLIEDEQEQWDYMVCDDIVMRAMRNGWKHISNVSAERMNKDTRLSVIFQDDDDFVRTDDGGLVPAFYKSVLKLADADHSYDIIIDHFYSRNGDNGPWSQIPADNELVIRKIRRACQDVILDARDYHVLRMDESVYDMVRYKDRQVRADFTILMPWMRFQDGEVGNFVMISNPFDFTETKDIIDIFHDYLKTHCEGNHFVVSYTKREQVDMDFSAIIIRNGVSHEYNYTFNETREQRREHHKREMDRILSIKKEGE